MIRLVIILGAILAAMIGAAPVAEEIITESDLNIIKYSDIESTWKVLMKIRNIYEKQGKEALIPAVPALIDRTVRELQNFSQTEGEGEILGDFILVLSVTGDSRMKPVFLQILSSPVGGTIVSKGFLNIGRSVIPDLIDSLGSASDYTKRATALTLSEICEFDTTGTFFNEEDKANITDKLIIMLDLKDHPSKFGALRALGYFGDESILPVLENIKNNDTLVTEKGFYLNRDEAAKAIENIRKRN